jgi:hypothetical protein
LPIGENDLMDPEPASSHEQARRIGEAIGIEWSASRFDVDWLRLGLGVELEHGLRDAETARSTGC